MLSRYTHTVDDDFLSFEQPDDTVDDDDKLLLFRNLVINSLSEAKGQRASF